MTTLKTLKEKLILKLESEFEDKTNTFKPKEEQAELLWRAKLLDTTPFEDYFRVKQEMFPRIWGHINLWKSPTGELRAYLNIGDKQGNKYETPNYILVPEK